MVQRRTKLKIKRVPPFFWFIVGLGGLFVYTIDYRFIVSDQTEYLLGAFRDIYPDFCVNDWFVWQTTHLHFTFNKLVVLLSYLGNLGIVFFLVYLLVSILFLWGMIMLINLFDGDINILPIVYVFTFYFAKDEISSAGLMGGSVLPGTLAPLFVILFIYWLVNEKYLLAGLMGGFSGFFHITFGYGIFIILILYLFSSQEFRKNKLALFAPLVALLVMLPNLVPAIRHFGSTVGGDIDRAYDVFIHYRSSHHLFPPHYNTEVILSKLGIYCLGAIEIVTNYSKPVIKKVGLLMSIIVSLCLLTLFFSFVYYWPTYLLFYFWRFIPYVSLVAIILVSIGLKELLAEKDWSLKLLALVIILALGISSYYKGKTLIVILPVVVFWLCLRFTNIPKQRNVVLVGCGGIALLLVIILVLEKILFTPLLFAICFSLVLLSAYYVYSHKLKAHSYTQTFILMLVLAIILTTSMTGTGAFRLHRITSSGLPRPLIQLSQWAKLHTPPGTIFISPPDIIGFRALSHRGLLVNVKCAPRKPVENQQWQKRILALVDLPAFPDYKNDEWFMLFLNRYMSLPPDHFLRLAKKYDSQYLIAYKDQSNLFQFVKDGWSLAYENPVYAVFRIPTS